MDGLLELANKCPLTDGAIVYAARNWYNSLTEQDVSFDDACDGINYAGRGIKRKPPVKRHDIVNDITVYPNPTNGYFYISLPNQNKACWQITVTNIYGKRIMEKTLRSNASKTFININGGTGIYFINVLNCTTGKLEVKKVILQ